MTQTTKPIDLTKTYIPGDPNAFPANLVYNAGEDQPVDRNPILAYEGWNFLPTNYGYKSYFGTNGELDVDSLPANADWVLLYQKKSLENFLVALTDSGIYTKTTDVSGAWLQEIVLPIPDTGVHNDWTWCVIGEDFYAYRQAGEFVYKISPYVGFWIANDPPRNLQAFVDIVDNTATIPADTYTYYVAYKEAVTGHIALHGEGLVVVVPTLGDSVDLTWLAPTSHTVDEYVLYRVNSAGLIEYRETNSATLAFTDTGAGWAVDTLPVAGAIQYDPYEVQTKSPNTLNMAGQLGIFKAGSRLGFWDSDNSISWSGLDDKFDFVPSLITLANAGQKFDDVIGKIVTIKQSKENFIIYSTKSIVYIQRNITEAFIWKSIPITNKTGIAYPKEVTTGTIDTEHFAWTGMGLMRIENNTYEIIVPGVVDFLREAKEPVYLSLLQNRYLFLQLINPDYVYGKVSFQTEIIPPIILDFIPAWVAAENPGELPCYAYSAITKTPDKVWVYNDNKDEWDTLTKAIGGNGLGYPINKDVPRFKGDYKRHLGSAAVTEGLKLIPGIVAGTGLSYNLTFYYTNSVGGISFLSNIITAAGLPDLSVIETEIAVDVQAGSNFSNTGSIVSVPIADVKYTFENAMQDWYGETRYLKEYIKAREGHQVTQAFDSGPGAVPDAQIPFLLAGISKYTDNIGGNDPESIAGGLIRDFIPIGVYPVEYYPSRLTAEADYNYFILVQHIKRLAFLYYKVTKIVPTITPTGGGLNRVQFNTTIELKVEYADIPECPSGELEASGGFLQVFFDLHSSLVVDRMYKIARIYIQDFIRYDIAGNSSASPTVPIVPPDFNTDFCPIDSGADDSIMGVIYGGFNTVTGKVCGNPPQVPGPVFAGNIDGIVIPGSSFLIQDGSPAPLYPTFEGALVFDTQLKRWGKFKGQYKELLDYAPINNISTGIIPYAVFGVEGAVLKPNGKIASFDEAPSDSLIKYGKIGYTRSGFTDAEEIVAHFRRASTGFLGFVCSIDGRTEEVSLASATEFTNAMVAVHPGDVSAQWFSITLTGLFDLQHLEFTGHRKSRR